MADELDLVDIEARAESQNAVTRALGCQADRRALLEEVKRLRDRCAFLEQDVATLNEGRLEALRERDAWRAAWEAARAAMALAEVSLGCPDDKHPRCVARRALHEALGAP